MRAFDWAIFDLYNRGLISYDDAVRAAMDPRELQFEHPAPEPTRRARGSRAGGARSRAHARGDGQAAREYLEAQEARRAALAEAQLAD